MEVFYGNDGNNYRIFAQSPEMPQKAVETLLNNYMKYLFIKNKEGYSSVANEPESIFYVSSDLNGQFSSEKAILCKNGHMSRFATPSFFFHAHTEEVGKDFYKKDFFDLFSLQFVADTEMEKYDNHSISEYQIGRGIAVRDDGLTDDQLKMILYKFLDNERMGKPVKIVLDKTGDAYNLRSREVLKAIYHYLPYGFRRRYGFLSYCDEMQSCSSRIRFVLYDRQQVKEIEGMDVDLAESQLAVVRSTVNKTEFLEYADYLVELSAEEREKHFEVLEKISEGKLLSVEDCINYYKFEKNWSSKTVEELMPEWVDYMESNSFYPTAMYAYVADIIGDRMNNEYYNEYLFQELEAVDLPLNLILHDNEKVVLFAQRIKGLNIDEQRMLELIDRKCPTPTDGDVQEKMTALSEDIALLEGIRTESKQLQKILAKAVEERNLQMNELKDAYQLEVRREGEEIREQLKRGRTLPSYIQASEELLETAKYPESREYIFAQITGLLKRICDFLEKDLNGLEPQVIEEHLQHIDSMLSYFGGKTDLSVWEKRAEALKTNYNRIKSESLDSNILLTERRNLIGNVRKLYDLELAFERYGQKNPVVYFCIGKVRVECPVKAANRVLEFLIAPNEDNVKNFRNLLGLKPMPNGGVNMSQEAQELFRQLLARDMFVLDHYQMEIVYKLAHAFGLDDLFFGNYESILDGAEKQLDDRRRLESYNRRQQEEAMQDHDPRASRQREYEPDYSERRGNRKPERPVRGSRMEDDLELETPKKGKGGFFRRFGHKE